MEPIQAPTSAATIMDDCYPGAAGGLYPFFVFSTSVNGIAIGNTPLGLGVGWREDLASTAEYFIAANDGSNRLYRSTTGYPSGSWSLIETNGPGIGGGERVQFIQVIQGSGAGRIFFSGDTSGGGGGIGTRLLNSGAVSTQVDVTGKPPLVSHQSRLVCCSSTKTSLRWTDPGGITLPAANTLTPDPGGGAPTIVSLSSHSPSDLLVTYASGAAVLVQGDITDPLVRTLGRGPKTAYENAIVERMSDSTLVMPFYNLGPHRFNGETWVPFNTPTQMDAGQYTSFALAGGGFLQQNWATGSNGNRVTPQFKRYGNWLFTPFGFVYDERTQSWLHSTGLNTAWHYVDSFNALGALDAVEAHNGITFGGQAIGFDDYNNDAPFAGAGVSGSNGYLAFNRSSSYTWQSVPLRHPLGQLSSAREVEVFIQNNKPVTVASILAALPAGATLNIVVTVTVTVNGVSRSATTNNTRPYEFLRFQFPRGVDRFSTVKVNVTSVTTSSSLLSGQPSAPPIESIRVGFSEGKLQRPS